MVGFGCSLTVEDMEGQIEGVRDELHRTERLVRMFPHAEELTAARDRLAVARDGLAAERLG